MSHEYEQAAGILEWACTSAAIDLETLVRNSSAPQWEKDELLKTARELRHARERSEKLCEFALFGCESSVHASEPEHSNELRPIL